MKPDVKVYLVDDNNDKFFGDGPVKLLKGIEETGSLKASALKMGMAYSKASRILHNAENALGFELCEKTIGGKKGGGSIITEKGKEFIKKYEEYASKTKKANEEIYKEIFSKF